MKPVKFTTRGYDNAKVVYEDGSTESFALTDPEQRARFELLEASVKKPVPQPGWTLRE